MLKNKIFALVAEKDSHGSWVQYDHFVHYLFFRVLLFFNENHPKFDDVQDVISSF